MIFFMTIRFTRSGVAGIGRRQLQEIGRLAIGAVGLYWWKNYLPIHFTRRALRRYHYRPREGDPGSGRPFKGSYSEAKTKHAENGQKVRAIGENKPYVWSGRSRSQATASPHIVTVAPNYKTYRAEVRIPTNTLNYLRGRINADEELRRTTPDEDRQHERVFADEYEAQLNLVGRTARMTTTIAA